VALEHRCRQAEFTFVLTFLNPWYLDDVFNAFNESIKYSYKDSTYRGFGLNLDAVLHEAQEQIVKAIMPEIQSRIESSVKANVPTLQEIVELLAARIPVPKVNIDDVVNQVVAIARFRLFPVPE
jgi:hypothetical protein